MFQQDAIAGRGKMIFQNQQGNGQIIGLTAYMSLMDTTFHLLEMTVGENVTSATVCTRFMLRMVLNTQSTT